VSEYDFDLLAHTCSSQEILRVLEEQAAEIERLKALITELALGIDAVQLDTCMQRDWDMLNEVAKQAREATR
jgi:hypothetical protein